MEPSTDRRIPEAECEFPAVGLTVWHPELGTVTVTKHAWERFLERYPLNIEANCRNTLGVVGRLSVHFRKAERAELDPVKRVRRLLNNSCVEVHYLETPGCNLRFVVSKEANVMLTVELMT